MILIQILESKLDLPVAIEFIERVVKQETLITETHQILNNESDYLLSEYQLAHLKILLSLLRRCGDIQPGS